MILEIENAEARQYLDTITEDVADDKRFVYYLLASKGICVVPLTGFCCNKKGFRVTLLETDDEKRKGTWTAIATVASGASGGASMLPTLSVAML